MFAGSRNAHPSILQPFADLPRQSGPSGRTRVDYRKSPHRGTLFGRKCASRSMMSQPVTIENDALRMDVWPQLGGKVSSLVDKSDNYDLLFSYPVEYPIEHSQYDLPYHK